MDFWKTSPTDCAQLTSVKIGREATETGLKKLGTSENVCYSTCVKQTTAIGVTGKRLYYYDVESKSWNGGSNPVYQPPRLGFFSQTQANDFTAAVWIEPMASV